MAKPSPNLPENTRPASDLEERAADLLRQVRETRRPVVFTEIGRSSTALVDLEAYQGLLDEIDLLRDVHRGLADAEAGRVTPHEEAMASLLARYS